jgi:hypothetical protein
MWYYSVQNQQAGPVDEETIKGLISAKTIESKTLVWKKGMETWLPADATSLAAFLPAAEKALAQVPPPVIQNVVKTPEMEVKELNDLFTWYWICLVASVFTFGLSAIASMVLFYIIVYKSWKLIQDGHARTSAGKAVGFQFIPFFNLYWVFEAFPGFFKDANAYIQRYNLPIKAQDDGLATAYCVLSLLCIVPYLNILAGIAVFVLQIIMLKNFKDFSVELIRTRK